MEFNEYQQQDKNFGNYNKILGPYATSLNLVSSVGKLSDTLSQVLNRTEGVINDKDMKKIQLYLGDILHDVSSTATSLGIDLDDIAMTNIRKNYLLHQKEIENK